MKPIKVHAEQIILALETYKVLRTDQLTKMFNCSHRTLYVKLSQYEYISSINQARRFLTLAKTPEFDQNGLWEQEGVVFSKWGGIKETIVSLVNSSKMGLTPTQISKLLRTTVTPQLLKCLKEGKAIRMRFGRNQVYFSSNKSIARSQIKKRQKRKKSTTQNARKDAVINEIGPFDIENVHFGFLAQLLLSDTLTADDIYLMLDGMGKPVEREEIKEIVIRHNIELKKTQIQLVFPRKRTNNVEYVKRNSP